MRYVLPLLCGGLIGWFLLPHTREPDCAQPKLTLRVDR